MVVRDCSNSKIFPAGVRKDVIQYAFPCNQQSVFMSDDGVSGEIGSDAKCTDTSKYKPIRPERLSLYQRKGGSPGDGDGVGRIGARGIDGGGDCSPWWW